MVISKKTSQSRENNRLQVISKTFENNKNSDYTEKIKQLEKGFDYSSNSSEYWCFPEQSILYGTPFYEAASDSQKIALNHLFWVMQYSKIANDEVGTVLFNQLTASVFSRIEDCQELCQELELETAQEKYHIHAFQRVGYLTRKSLLGKTVLSTSSKQSVNNNFYNLFYRCSYNTIKYLSKIALENKEKYASDYLKELDSKKNMLLPTDGFFSRRLPFIARIPTSQLYFWQSGISPFIASQFYAIRFIANMMLKNWEYNYVQYLRQQEKNSQFVPIPTQISNFHLLDESFHTNMSKFISQQLYKYEKFPQPTAYEKMVGNSMIYLTQFNLDGLSAAIPYRFVKDDASFINIIFNLMKSPLFGLSTSEAMNWLKECFCEEHQGFHVALKNHQRLLLNLKKSFENVDYLWPINRKMQIADSVNINQSVISSKRAFNQFAELVKNID